MKPPTQFRGHDYAPLVLKTLMLVHGISQTDLAARVVQANGRPMSHPGISQILNHNYWPRGTAPEALRAQIEEVLRQRGVEDEDIARAWEPDPGPQHHLAHPKGVHADRYAKPAEPDIEPLEVEVLSPAAKKNFAIFKDPFQDDISGPEDVFLSQDQRYVREAMYIIARHGGFLAVTGESGAGKSVLRRDMIERFAREGAPVVVIYPQSIDKTRLNASNICDAIIDDLAPGASRPNSLEAKARKVQSLLVASSRANNAHVLLIEEAHDLSVPTLKYLKRFLELEDGFRRLLAIILVGQTELRDRLDERRNPDAREVIRRCEIAELLPLDNHLQDYLAHKFRRAGLDASKILAPDAYDAITARLTRARPGHREVLSQLYPLVVNNLVTKAMNAAARICAPLVTADLIKEL